jgi:Zn finger protein HypA/HybF involved in hydrogenase expression
MYEETFDDYLETLTMPEIECDSCGKFVDTDNVTPVQSWIYCPDCMAERVELLARFQKFSNNELKEMLNHE